jgi:tannase/feruloyl esterase
MTHRADSCQSGPSIRGKRGSAPRLRVLALAAMAMGLAPGAAWANALPTCAALATSPEFGLVGNPQIVPGTITSTIVPAAPALPVILPFLPTATPPTPAYCKVSFTFSSGLAGPGDGYDVGQVQKIQIIVVLPLSAADGGATGSTPNTFDHGGTAKTVAGNWIGKVLVSAGPGTSGSATSTALTEGLNTSTGDPGYAIRLGYSGSLTDTGQHNPPFVLIPSGPLANTLDRGTIADWVFRGTHYGKEWAVALSQTYYGEAPTRVYYNGGSGGGNEGIGQLIHFGDEYDGILVTAPAIIWDQFTLAYTWPYVVFKKMLQQGGTMPTTSQETALTAAVFAACDGLDGVVDGIINDPRQCRFSATANICGKAGAPVAPDCLTPAQAAAFDKMWDGPRNRFGLRIWYPFDKSIPFVGGPFTALTELTTNLDAAGSPFIGLADLTIKWNHENIAFDPNDIFEDEESIALAGNPPGAITYEDEATLGSNTVADFIDNQSAILDKAVAHGTKVIHFHGTADPAIFWRDSVNYYRRVATAFGGGEADFKRLQRWYRFFPIPDVGHGTGAIGGGTGPSPVNPFNALVNWVENGVAPDSITALAAGVALDPGRTRPLCPYPQTAIYKGSGSTDVASSFFCGGNLETRAVACDDVVTVYKHENEDKLDFRSFGVSEEECEAHHHRQSRSDDEAGTREP